MRLAGTLLLAAGVGLCAAFGARQTPETFERTRLEGRAHFASEAEGRAFRAYCAGRERAGLPAADGCAGTGAADAAPAAPEVARLREAWRARRERTREAVALAAATAPEPPAARVARWVETSGLPFAIGLALLLSGAVTARVGLRRAARAAAGSPTEGAVDFGAQLGALRAGLARLAAEMDRVDAAERADAARCKAELEALQERAIEPLVEAREALQLRYGLAGFAAVFGPLSAAERRVNRAWSALVDGHWVEAHDAVGLAASDAGVAELELSRLADAG